MLKPIIAVALIIAAPFLIGKVMNATEFAFESFECKFDERRMQEIKNAMPDYDASSIEAQLSGKTCKETVQWIDESWKKIHADAESAYNPNLTTEEENIDGTLN